MFFPRAFHIAYVVFEVGILLMSLMLLLLVEMSMFLSCFNPDFKILVDVLACLLCTFNQCVIFSLCMLMTAFRNLAVLKASFCFMLLSHFYT